MFGNDFDSPVRDRLPPGFGTALRIVKWAVDPGIEGDVYADRPFLYGNALSSVNALRVGGLAQPDGDGQEEEEEREGVVEEGGEMGGDLLRNQLGVPSAPDQRRKWFLARDRTDGWVWEKGRVYWCDFFNPYLDFNREFPPPLCFSFHFLFAGGEGSSYLLFFLFFRAAYSGKKKQGHFIPPGPGGDLFLSPGYLS